MALSECVSPLDLGWVRDLSADLDLVLGNASHLGIAEGLALWDRCLASDPADPPCRDLLWTELGDWRRAVASRFDGVRARNLESIRAVTVTVAEGPGGRLKAWLFLGWLASRSGVARARRITAKSGVVDGAGPGRGLHTPRGHDGLRGASPRVSVCWRRLPAEGAILVEEAGAPAARLNQTKTSRASAVVEEIRRREMPRAAREAMDMARRWSALERP